MDQNLNEEILELLMTEILRDGRVDQFEKEALAKVCSYLGISKFQYAHVQKKVSEKVLGDAGERPLNFIEFIYRACKRLREEQGQKEVEDFALEIGSILGVEELTVHKVLNKLFLEPK